MSSLIAPSSRLRIDNRSEAQKQVARLMEWKLGSDSPPLSVDEINLWVDHAAASDLDWQARQRRNLDDQRLGRGMTPGLGPGSHVTDDLAYQEMIKDECRKKMALRLSSNALSEAAVSAIYIHYNPEEGLESWVDRNHAVLLRDIMDEGSSAIMEGRKKSGKTAHGALHFETVDNLHAEWISNAEESTLYRSRRRMGQKAPGEEYQRKLRQLRDQASIGPENLTEEWWREWKTHLGILGCTEVQWVTNIGLLPKSPHRKHYLYCPTMVDIQRGLLNGDLEAKFTVMAFDEAAAYANKMSQQSGSHRQMDEMFNTFRKDNASATFITQTEKGHLSDTMREQTSTHITMRRVGEKRQAMYTVTRLVTGKTLRDIPEPAILYDTQDRGTFRANCRPSNMWGYVAGLQRERERDYALHRGSRMQWTHREAVKAALAWLQKEAVSDKRIAEGASPDLIADIRYYFYTRDPATEMFLSNRKILLQLQSEDPQMYANLTEARIAEEREIWTKQKREQEIAANSGSKAERENFGHPQDPDDLLEAFEP